MTKRQLAAVLLLSAMAALAVGEPALWKAAGPVLAIAAFLLSRPLQFKFDLVNVSVIVFVVYVCASWLWSEAPWVSFISAISYISAAIAFIAFRHVVTTAPALRTVALGYLTGCAYLVARLVSLAISVAGEPIGGRLNLPGINANYAGYALAAGFAVILLLWTTGASTRLYVAVYVAAGAFLVIGIVLAGARASLVALVALGLWLVLTHLLRRPPLKALLVVVGVSFAIVVSGIVDGALFVFDDTADRSTGGLSGRLDLWPLARSWWLDHFFVGSGTSSFQSSNPYYAGAHNLVLELGTGLGVLGVIGFVLVLVVALKEGDRFLVGGFIAVSTASYLTGHWETAPAAWVGLALFSKSALLNTRTPSRQHRQSAPQADILQQSV